MNSQEPICEGPLCACDKNQLRQIRALVRSTIDGPEKLDDPKEWLTQYDKVIVDTVERAALKAKACFHSYPHGVLAVSLLSGITSLWGRGPDFESHRISLILANDDILSDEERYQAGQRLAALHHSPLHAIYHQPRDKRPLWTCFEKPEKAQVISKQEHFSKLYKVVCPATAQTYTDIASNIISQETTEPEIKELLLAVGTYLDGIRYSDDTLVFGVFNKPEDMTNALLDTAQAFTTSAGRYLWVFGFDVEQPPSPYRAVVVSSNDKVECDPTWRRWLNTLAAILGEIAAVERSMAIFVHSVKAKAFTIKRDEAKWKQLSNTHETQGHLKDHLERLQVEAKTDETKKELVETVIAIRGLLPKTEATLAHRHTVLSMRHYQVPSFRDVLLQYRTIENPEQAIVVFKGILRTLGETFYAHNILELAVCPRETYDITLAQYIDKAHFDKFRERSNHVTTHLLGLRKSPHISATHLRLLDAIEVIYRDEPLAVTYRCGEEGVPLKQNTLPVYSVLEEIEGNPGIRKLLTPPQLHWTHGDLHFGNILLDVSDLDDPVFKLIDQGVDIDGRDIANDLSKLLQSCHGLGDFIQEGLFDITVFERPKKQKRVQAALQLEQATPRWMVRLTVGLGEMKWPLSGGVSGAEVFKFIFVKEQVGHFKAISSEFYDLVEEQLGAVIGSTRDPDWFLRAKFTEALNMLTSPPFFLQKDIPASLAFAVTGAIVLTEWCSDQRVQEASTKIRDLVEKSKTNKA